MLLAIFISGGTVGTLCTGDWGERGREEERGRGGEGERGREEERGRGGKGRGGEGERGKGGEGERGRGGEGERGRGEVVSEKERGRRVSKQLKC